MLALLEQQRATIYNRTFPGEDPLCRQTAQRRYHGFLGPWLELDDGGR